MSTMTTTLTRAIFGLGNQNHAHVHRHNTMNINSMDIDKLRYEQMAGGIMPATINTIAQASGELTARPQGYVSLEEGYNVRRGIALLNFMVESNAMQQSELAVVGYLVGGTYTEEGVAGDTLFVPVRCWTTLTTNTHDHTGFPMTKTVIDSSQQFLMGDPNQQRDLKAVRPIDIGSEALGYEVTNQDGSSAMYSGTAGSDLRNNVLVSKTQNLNPTHHSRELLRLATVAGNQMSMGQGVEMAIADGLVGESIGEISATENPFFHTMMFTTGIHQLAGFAGFSIGEINAVFENMPDVMSTAMLDVTRFADDDALLNSTEYGSANMHETIATELAMCTVHLLLQSGLMSLAFSATNNPTDFEGVVGSDSGVAFLQGPAMSVLDGDMHVANRVESFKHLISTNFFAKYTGPYAHLRNVLSVEVDCHLFGEIAVTIFFNGDTSNARRYVNASYYINRTSSSISGTETGLLEAKNFLTNIKEHFQ